MPDAIAERIEMIDSRTFGIGVDSANRIEVMLGLCIGQPSEVFWPVLIDTFNMCDDTWAWKGVLLGMLRAQATRPPIEATSWPLRIWRGCSRPRVRGLSWTTDQAIAGRFAHGHRMIRVPDPVVAEATVDRSSVFVEINGRKEQEVLIDPRGLADLVVRKVTTLPPWAASNALSPEADLLEPT